MTGITHKQAQRNLYADADGLLRDDQRALLEAHLRECTSCRMEAEKLHALEGRLKQSFQASWDSQEGPSKNVMSNIRSQTGRIITSNRIHIRLKTLVALLALLVLGIFIDSVFRQLRNSSKVASATPRAISSSQESKRLIAFVSAQDGNSEIYVMNFDGTDIRNITNNPAYDGSPVWSPDGSKIAFETDRNGNLDIFVMNADGSGLMQLTHDRANDVLGASPQVQLFGVKAPEVWSPDGSHILFSNDRSGKWMLYVMDADGGGVTQLVQANDPPAAGILWSPDGQQVVYTSIRASGPGQIVAVNIDGTHRRELGSSDPAKGDNGWLSVGLIAWSQDHQFLYYEYQTSSGTWHILKVGANGLSAPQEIISGYALVQGLLVGSAWRGSDSALDYITQAAGGTDHGSTWHRTDGGTTLRWDPFAICGVSASDVDGIYPITNWASSKTGSQLVLGVTCANQGNSELYSLDSNNATSNKIAQIPTEWSDIHISWSADDQVVLIQGTNKSGRTELYLLNAQDLQSRSLITPKLIWSGANVNAVLQPVLFKGLATTHPPSAVPTLQPAPSPTPLWAGASNGDLIAFVSDANGNSDIYLAKNDGSNITDLTHRPADDFNPIWSPDGNWIAFASGFSGNFSLHVMRPDGSDERRIADIWWNFSWSPDSHEIAYLGSLPANPSDAYSPARTSLKIIDLDGNVLQDTYLGVFNQADQLRWSQDGQSLSYVASQIATDNSGATTATESDIYQIGLGAKQPVLRAKSDHQIDAWIPTGRNLTYLARDIFTWNFIQTNGPSRTKLAIWDPVTDQCKSAAPFNWENITSSPGRRWSPDRKRLLLEITCPDNNTTWLYLGSTNGAFVKLLNYPILSQSFGQDSLSWSPDGQYIVFSSDLDSIGNLDIYVLNVDAALKDASTRPLRIVSDGFYESSPNWQPQP